MGNVRIVGARDHEEVRTMISNERLTQALTYLASTDSDLAMLKVEMHRKEYLCGIARAREFLAADGNIPERKAKAEVSEEVVNAENARLFAMGEYEKLRAKRETEVLIVECWRTEQANRRAGNL